MKRERGRIQSCLFVGAAFQRFRASKNMSFWRNKIPGNNFVVNYKKKSGNFLCHYFFLIPNAKCFEYRQTFCMMINRQFLTIVIGFFLTIQA